MPSRRKTAQHVSLVRDLIPDPIASRAPSLSVLAASSTQHLAPPSAKLRCVLCQAPVQGILVVETRKSGQEGTSLVQEVVEGVDSPLQTLVEEEVVSGNARGDKDHVLSRFDYC